MRMIKPLLYATGAAIVLAGVGFAILLSSFDAERIKTEVESMVLEKTGRTVVIGEPIGLSVFPSLALSLGGVRLSERGRPADEFASVERMRISVRLLPLLSKRVEAQEIELGGAKLRVVVGKDGRRNIDDLAAPTPAAATGSGTGKEHSAAIPRFEIAGLRIERAALQYRDERDGSGYAISDLSLVTGTLANAATADFQVAGRVRGGGTDLGFESKGKYRYDLGAGSFEVDRLTLGARGNAQSIRGLDLSMQVSAFGLNPAKEISVREISLKAKGQSNGDGFDLALDAPRLQLGAGKLSGDSVKVDARLTGKDQVVQLQLLGTGLGGTTSAMRFGRCTLKIDGKRGADSLTGTAAVAVGLDLVARTADLAGMTGDFSISTPALPEKTARIRVGGATQVDWGRQKAVGQTTLQLDDSNLRAKWDVSRFSPLAASFDLSADRLDLDRYRSSGVKGAAGVGTAPPPQEASNARIDLGALQGKDLRGSIRIGVLQVSNLKLANLRTEVKLSGGRLDFNGLAASLYDGRTEGTASIDANGKRFSLRQNLSAININPLIRDLAAKDIIEGRGSLTVDVATSGVTVPALKQALSGQVSLSLKDGAIKGINLAKSFRELKAKIGAKQESVQRASVADRTDFTEMSVSFRIAAGVAHSDDLSVKSPFLRLGGAGHVNLGLGSVDYLARASVVNTSGGQQGKELEHVKGMTIPVRLIGPFENLAYRIEFAALVEEAAKAKVKEKVSEKVQQSAGEKLKGLFRK